MLKGRAAPVLMGAGKNGQAILKVSSGHLGSGLASLSQVADDEKLQRMWVRSPSVSSGVITTLLKPVQAGACSLPAVPFDAL